MQRRRRLSVVSRLGPHLIALLIGLSGMLVPAELAQAQVTLETAANCGSSETGVECRVEVKNRGSDPVLDLSSSVRLLGRILQTPNRDKLQPGETELRAVQFDAPEMPLGRQIAIIQTAYTDPGGFQRTALSYSYADLGGAHESSISATLGDLEIADETTVQLRLENTGSVRESLAVTLVLPQELGTDDPLTELELEPGESARLGFPISNQGALPGSSYSTFAVVESRDPRRPGSVVAPGRLTIRGNAGLGPLQLLLWIALVLSLGVFVRLQLAS